MKTSFLQLMKTGLIAAAVSAVINIVLFYIFKAAGLITDAIEIEPGKPLQAFQLVFAGLIPSVVASILLYFLLKYTKNGFKIFTIITIVLSLVFFMNPFMGIKGVTVGYAVALDIMHIPVAGALWYFHKRALTQNA